MKTDPHHPSLHFKQVDRFWSSRVGLHYRAVAVEAPDGMLWFWIGTHAEYDKLIGQPPVARRAARSTIRHGYPVLCPRCIRPFVQSIQDSQSQP